MIEQRTDQWKAQRAGKITASSLYKVLATIKTCEAAERRNYRAQLVAERLTGKCAESFTSAAIIWGIDTEPQARAGYAFLYDATVVEEAFVDHPTIAMSGASPDGLVCDDGLIEIKCPNTATHIETLKSEAVDSKYITQMQWQMACTGRAWCDFLSFDPRLPDELQMFVKRIPRDDARIAELEAAVLQFNSEIQADIAALLAISEKKAA